MDFAVAKKKNPSSTWLKVRVSQRKKQKKSAIQPKRGKQAKRAPELREKLRKGTRALMKGLLVAGAAAAVYQAAVFFTTSPRFAVSRVTVTGNEMVKNPELREALKSVSRQNIFLIDLEAVARQFEAHPWVKTAAVRKVFPSSLHVQLRERAPFARIQHGETYVMDSEGVLLTRDAEQYSHLPLVVHSEQRRARPGETVAAKNVVESLRVMRALNGLPFFQNSGIESARIRSGQRVEFATGDEGTRVFMALGDLKENFRNFRMLMNTLERQDKHVDRIDLSFKNQVVVRYR